MSTTQQALLLVFAILALNGLTWAVILVLVRARGRRQRGRHGAVAAPGPDEPVELEAEAAYLGTLVDGRRYFAPGYWARGSGVARLTAGVLSVRRWGAGRPVLVPLGAVTRIERRSRFAGRGAVAKRITVLEWRMGGGRFETGIVFGTDEDERLDWERRLAGPVTD